MSIPVGVHRRIPRRIPLSIGFSKYCLGFNASLSQYLDHGNVLNMGTVDFVLEAWFKTTMTGVSGNIIRKRSIGTTAPGYELRIHGANDQVVCSIRDAAGNSAAVYDGVGGFNDGKWHHVVAVVDRDGVISLYLDGQLVNTSGDISGVGDLDNDVIFSIGSREGIDAFFDGCIDEVKVYRGRTMSLKEVRHNFLNYHNPIRDNLVLWLRFEEGRGLTAYDLSGQGNHGALKPASSPPAWTRVREWELRSDAEL